MSNIDKQALRQLATDAHELGIIKRYSKGLEAQRKFYAAATPLVIRALLDELEAAERERDNLRNSFDNERFRADKLAEAFKAEHEQLVMANGALITQHVKANGAKARIAELEALLSAIGKSRPGGVYFNKWASKINEALNYGK
ncbi:ead/Ea22-like family protein [Citrobacter koseri]